MSSTHRQLSNAPSLMSLWPLEVDSARDHQNQVFQLCGDQAVTSPPLPLAPLDTKFCILRSKSSSTYHQLSSALLLMSLRLLEVESSRDHQYQVFRPCGDPTVTSIPPAPSTPECQIWYSEVRNELYSPSAFQRTIACHHPMTGST